MEILWVVLSVVVSISFWITRWVYRWKNPRSNGELPPGSMGLPIIGESIEFFSPYSAASISPFIKKRMERYGSIFRTSLVGRPVVISTDPDLNRFIFQQEGKLFQSWYMDSFDDIVGRDNLLSVHGSLHKYLRNLILNLFGGESLRERLLPDIEDMTCKHLKLWSSQPSVELKEAATMMIFNFSIKRLFSCSESESTRKLRQSYAAFLYGLISFPIPIPGTAYWKCLQGRKRARKMIKSMLDERRASTVRRQRKDFLDLVIEEVKKGFMSEQTALDLLFALPFAAYESTTSAMALALQYLREYPAALAELTKEHEAILMGRENEESGITWKEYKSMTFTHMVINETVRLANIVPGIFRKVLKEVELKGYTIPAGWILMVYPTTVHLNPEKYHDPLAFNPWRWKDQELHAGSQNFMAFGGGVRLCVGAEFVKLQMAIFLHHLVTKYRWSLVKGGDAVRYPGLVFPNGFHIQILEKDGETAQKAIKNILDERRLSPNGKHKDFLDLLLEEMRKHRSAMSE